MSQFKRFQDIGEMHFAQMLEAFGSDKSTKAKFAEMRAVRDEANEAMAALSAASAGHDNREAELIGSPARSTSRSRAGMGPANDPGTGNEGQGGSLLLFREANGERFGA